MGYRLQILRDVLTGTSTFHTSRVDAERFLAAISKRGLGIRYTLYEVDARGVQHLRGKGRQIRGSSSPAWGAEGGRLQGQTDL